MTENPAGSYAVRAEHVTKAYRLGRLSVPALRDVTLGVPEQAMVCVLGRSGSGKSALLRQFGLLDAPDQGMIYLGGQDVTCLSRRARARLRLERVGHVFRECALLPELTAQENVALPALMLGGTAARARRRAAILLEGVGLADRLRCRPRELSGGERQRAAVARALVNGPGVVLADEPTAHLDSASARAVMEALARLNVTRGVAVIFASRDPEDSRYATRLVRMRDGQITGEG